MKTVTRYHPLLVILHWLLAVLIIGALLLGYFGIALSAANDPGKIDRLELHMAAGMLILVLMLVRLGVRLFTAKPAPAPTGHAVVDRWKAWGHYGFYIIVPLMAASGYTTAILAHLPQIVFQRSGAPLPADFMIYPTQVAHRFLAIVLSLLIAGHIAAVAYHGLRLRHPLLRRMIFGRRSVETR